MPIDLVLNQIEVKQGDQYSPVIGATVGGWIPAPSSAVQGDFLVYNGTNWVAQSIPSASGVSF